MSWGLSPQNSLVEGGAWPSQRKVSCSKFQNCDLTPVLLSPYLRYRWFMRSTYVQFSSKIEHGVAWPLSPGNVCLDFFEEPTAELVAH